MKRLFILTFLLVSCSTSQKDPSPSIRLAPMKKGGTRTQFEQTGRKFMVAGQGDATSKAGKRMFTLGGNAIDAFAAMSFVISVERPQSTGLGGGGFALVKLKGQNRPLAFDFREKAPFKSYSKMYLDREGNVIPRKSLDGIFSVGTPGLVAGVLEIHKKYGKLPLKTVIQDAINLAQKGLVVYPELEKAIRLRKDVLWSFPSSREIFFKKGRPLKTGDKLLQLDLAWTLEQIKNKGRRGFYSGPVAAKIVDSSRKYSGPMTRRDLSAYNVKQREPIHGTYRGLDIYSMSPPSSGGIHIVQILNMLEGEDLNKENIHSPYAVHMKASAMQLAFHDRAKYLGDSDFVKVPIKGLTSKLYTSKLKGLIKKESALSLPKVSYDPFKHEKDQTTHFSVMDIDGNVVSSTQTINGYFGSGLVAKGTGIVLNNEMDDFSAKAGATNLFGAVGSNKNLVAPEKRPLSSMSPTIVEQNGRPLMALGTPSGTRILTCVAQTLLNYFGHKLPLYESVAAVRVHHQWSPDYIRVGEAGLPAKTEAKLMSMGHKVVRKNLGCRIQAVAKEGTILRGVSDPRGEGRALGL